MKNKFSIVSLTALVVFLSSLSANAVSRVEEKNTKTVDHINWQMQTDLNPEELINKAIPKDSISLFFIRPADNGSTQTSANIAINDRYQVSLQPGGYTQVYSCAGMNRLSAEVTGDKTNDLLSDTSDFILKPSNNYFFYINVNSEGNSTIQKIEQAQALKALAGRRYQTHQITRVVPDCAVAKPNPSIFNTSTYIKNTSKY